MDVLMPQLGETVAEGKITHWYKAPGDAVAPGDSLFEIETDKTSMEVPATAAGVLSESRSAVGDVVPVDGIWFDDVWWYGGARDTVHMRAVAAEPRAVMHLPDPLRAVIVQGVVRRTNPAPEQAELMAEMSNEKYAHYGYQNDASAYAEVYGLHPSRVLAWSQFPTDATRFEFVERG